MKSGKFGVAAALGAGLCWAQNGDDISRLKSEVAKLKREIPRIEAEIRRTDSLSGEEAAAAIANLERRRRDRERREKENQALNLRLQEVRTKTAGERMRAQGAQNEAGEIKAGEKALLKLLGGFADSLLRRVESGLPWDSESRKERLLSVKRDVEAGSALPEEVFGRLAAILKEETKSGDEIALFNRPVTRQNGEVVNAQILKLGNRELLYMDEEEKNFGIYERGGWREELSHSEKNSVKLALAVKAGREPPQLVPLETAFALDSAAVGKGAPR